MTLDAFTVKVLDAVALTTADVYGFIIPTMSAKEIMVEVENVGTGTPIGTWSFQFSNDPQAMAEFWTEQRTGTRIGASSTAVWVAIDAPATVHGDSLTLAAAASQKSAVSFVLGLGGCFRVWYDYTSGGSAASLGTARVCVKE